MFKIKNLLIKNKDFSLEMKNVEIKKGDKVAILGRNGAGKTTFVETLLGIRKAQVFDVEKQKYSNLNAVFQDSSFDDNFKVKEILAMYCKLLKVKNIDLAQITTKFDVDKLINIKFRKLSAGEKQKVKICIALLNNPNLLILDELTTSLDIIWQKEIIALLKDYLQKKSDCTLIMITHNLSDMFALCNKAILFTKNEPQKFFDLKEKNQKIRQEIEEAIYGKNSNII